MKYINLLLIGILTISFMPEKRKPIRLCGITYYTKKAHTTITDYMLKASMMQIETSKGQFKLGWFVAATRNDSVFISGKMELKNDTIITSKYYHYGLVNDCDSIKNYYTCGKKGFIFLKYLTWKTDGTFTTEYVNKQL